MKNLENIPTVELTYSINIPFKDREKIFSSKDACAILKRSWKDIDHLERSKLVLMNRANQVLGIAELSVGGIAGAVIDIRVILQYAILANATSIILTHNHPSGNIKPSEADKAITEKIKKGCTLLDIALLDHIIVTSDGHYSFADEGDL